MTEADKIIDISTRWEDLKQNEQFGLGKKLNPRLINSAKNVQLTNNRKDWRQEEKGTTEDEVVGLHHQLNRHESE